MLLTPKKNHLLKWISFVLIFALTSSLAPVAFGAETEDAESSAIESDMSVRSSSGGPSYESGVEIELSSNPHIQPTIDEFTGALNYSYPLTLPSGRNQLQPDLSLDYNSLDSRNHSIVGYGWSLSTPYIQRLNREGSEQIFDDNSFSSSLSGELVAIDSETYKAKTEHGDFLEYHLSGNTWTVTDKSGTILTFGSSDSGRQSDTADDSKIFKWWLEEVRDMNDNFITYEYFESSGLSYPSQITYTGNGTSSGVFTVDFILETNSTPEKDFSAGFEVQNIYLIDAITMRVDGVERMTYDLDYTTGHNTQRMVLSSITEATTAEDGSVTEKPSTTFSYQETDDSWELAETWTMPFYEAGGTNYAYDLYYEAYTDHPSTYTDLIDVNGDALLDYVVMGNTTNTNTPANDRWYRVYLNTGDAWELAEDWNMPTFWTGTAYYSYELSSENTALMDVNGDGLPDFVVMDDTSVWHDPSLDSYYRVYMNTGTGWELDEEWTMPLNCGGSCGSLSSPTMGYKLFSANTKMMDVNGDGLPDFVLMDQINITVVDPSTVSLGYYKVFINSGNGWEVDEGWELPVIISGTYISTYDVASEDTQLLDVNGDQLPDLVAMGTSTQNSGSPSNDTYYRVMLNTGSGWGLDEEWTMPKTTNSEYYSLGIGQPYLSYELSSENTGLSDVNGDGLPDFVVMDDTTVWMNPSSDTNYRVFMNTGTGWELDEEWTMPSNCSYCTSTTGFLFSSENTGMMDVNGDGLPDFVNMDEGTSSTYLPGNYELYINTGTGWVLNEAWTMPMNHPSEGYYGTYNLLSEETDMADVNGDGLLDFIVMDGGDATTIVGNPVSDSQYRVYLNSGEMVDRLSSISFSGGASLSVSYSEQAILDRNPYSLTPTLYVVSEITSDDGMGVSSTTVYLYEDGKFYFHDEQYRSFTGFGSVTKTDSTGTITKTYHHQGNGLNTEANEQVDEEALIGLTYRTEVYDASENLYTRTVDTWDTSDLGDGSTFAYKTQSVSMDYEGGSSHKDRATSYTYDSDGNVKTVVNYGEVDADEDGTFTDNTSIDEKFIVTYTYATDSAGVIKNKVSEEKVKNSSGTMLKHTRTFYDDLSLGAVSTGNVTKQSEWLNTGSVWLSTVYTYNSYGLVTAVRNPRGYTTSYSYDSYNLYPTTITNPKGYTLQMEYDYATGQVTSRTDENGNTTEYTYDGFGRPLTVSLPDPTTGTLTTLSETTYDDEAFPSSASTTSTVGGVTSEQVVYYDGFGRTIQSNTLAEDGVYNTIDFWYDDQGNVSEQSLPYETSSSVFGRDDSQYGVTSTYDVLNRPLTVTDPNGSTTYDYSLWEVAITDPNGVDKTFTYSASGQLLTVEEENEGSTYTTSYTYDPLGQLLTLTDAQGNERNFSYDSLGRKISEEDLHDPSEGDFGTWTYTYDYGGNLKTRTDPKGQVITWAYDELDRPTYEDWDMSTPARNVSYVYDTGVLGRGKLYKVTSDLGGRILTYQNYDTLGNPTKELHQFKQPGGSTFYSYLFQTTYDLLSRPTRLIYPSSALTINTTYNAGGQIEKITRGSGTLTNVVSDFDYSPAGQVESMTYGNGTVTTNVFDPSQAYRLTNKTTTGTYNDGSTTVSGNVQDLSYNYDALGNITSIVDASVLPTAKTISYTYDDLNRLLTASTSGLSAGDYTESYSYDEVGNLTSKSDVGTLLYEGTGASGANPHAVTSVAGTAYTYDDNGNLTSNGSASYSWDKQDRLTASGSKTFSYDFAGQRYKIVDSSSGTDIYTYYAGPYLELRNGSSTSAGTPTYYIFAGGQRVAMREGTGANVIYNHQDHLGGTAVTTDASGTVSQIYDYYPYGAELENTQLGATDAVHSFTDKELDDSLGLYYFEARWYNPTIGRFVSQDPAQMDSRLPTKLIYDPQSLNFYAYSRNNPIVYVDPSGEEFNSETAWDAFVMWIDAAIEGTSAVSKGFAAGTTAPAGVVGSTVSADLAVGAMADLDDGMVASTNALGNTFNAFQGEETEVFMTEGPYDAMLPEEAQTTVNILQTASDIVQVGVNTANTLKNLQNITETATSNLGIVKDTMVQIFDWTYDVLDATLDVATGENSSQILER